MAFHCNLAIVVSIALIDLTFSGDNALAISAANMIVPMHQRRLALLLSAVGATILRLLLTIIVRLLLTIIVAFLLAIPWLQASGGLLILFITVRLLGNQRCKEKLSLWKISTPLITEVRNRLKWFLLRGQVALPSKLIGFQPEQKKISSGIATIVLADSITSLDNIIAIGMLGIATRTSEMVIGLICSKILLYLCSALIAELLRHFQLLVPIVSVLLVVMAGELIYPATDQLLRIVNTYSYRWLIYELCALAVVLLLSGGIATLRQNK